MLEHFLIYINNSGWGLQQKKSLLTLSGGVDSVVMAELFFRAGFPIGIAHCNFGLRGHESDLDEAFVRELALRYGAEFHSIRFDTEAFATQTKTSTQMAARTLRYDWFRETAGKSGYAFVATAHHATDHLETVLLNLTRGTGLRGLTGIPSVNGNIIRPLLFATRADIHAYALERELQWREDASNRSDYYRRNLIRHQVLPVLKTINPSLESTVSMMTDRLEAAEGILEESLNEWKKTVLNEKEGLIYLSVKQLLSCRHIPYRLHHLLEGYGFSYHQCREIAHTLLSPPGKQFYSPTHRLVRDREFLILAPLAAAHQNPSGHQPLSVEFFSRPEKIVFPANPSEAFFDADKLNMPLSLRPWKTGDWFCPLGMGGRKKKISDLLIDLKFDLIRKTGVYVVTDREDNIVWVVGLRNDHRFRVDDSTRRIARIRT